MLYNGCAENYQILAKNRRIMNIILREIGIWITFGLSLRFLYGLLVAGDASLAEVYTPALIIGLLFGAGLGLWQAIFGIAQHDFAYERNVIYKPVTCAWCSGSGKHLFGQLFRCRVCNGSGSVLAPTPHRRCRWCQGQGTETFLSLRCDVCDGTGWFYGRQDRS